MDQPDSLPPPDPEVAALLDFDPVPRKVKRPDGWSPELQREYIRRLAGTGSPQQACIDMGKNVTGIEALYKVPAAAGFRAAWDAALAIGRRRNGLDSGPPHLGPVPGIQRRPPRGGHARPDVSPPDDGDGDDIDELEQLDLLENIARKFLAKVVAEREARLAGKIVTADFYLRQITVLEIGFDLLVTGQGGEPMDELRDLRRDGHRLLHIADTPFSRLLDNRRREYWEAAGEPMRPLSLREEYLVDHGTHRTAVDQHALGADTAPARGYGVEQWRDMSNDDQRLARQRQFDEDAEEQLEWERAAFAEARHVSPETKATDRAADALPWAKRSEVPADLPAQPDRIDVTDSLRDGPLPFPTENHPEQPGEPPGPNLFHINDPYAYQLLRLKPPSMLPEFPVLRYNPVNVVED